MHRAKQYVIGLFERVKQARALTHDLEKLLVRYSDKRIDVLFQLLQTFFSNRQTLSALKAEGTCHNGHRQNTHVTRYFSDNRCSARTGAATHTGGHKYHIGAVQCLGNTISILKSGRATNLWICACTQTLGNRIT